MSAVPIQVGDFLIRPVWQITRITQDHPKHWVGDVATDELFVTSARAVSAANAMDPTAGCYVRTHDLTTAQAELTLVDGSPEEIRAVLEAAGDA